MDPSLRILVGDRPEDVGREGARILLRCAVARTGDNARFAAAVAGGSTPRGMHRMLAQDPFLSAVPWDRTHLFWVDERCVPQDDPASNYGTARGDFLERIPIPRANIHPMDGEKPPLQGALDYESLLKDFFDMDHGKAPALDLVFLGVGPDGHTASLFPGHRVLKEKERLVAAVRGGEPYRDRMTMTLPLLNQAREVVFLVTGQAKSRMMEALFHRWDKGLPANRVRPPGGRLTWLLDREAASLLVQGGRVEWEAIDNR
ncbi:MAG: 6-phosphogluconolactonase [Deltaproteobacteria bacterium]|nr:6-phosphogluconolactonase [Deltaproteobacteria bacterium]